MNAILCEIIITLSIILIFNSFVTIFAVEQNSTESITNDFTNKLKSKINNLISNSLNNTNTIINSSSQSNGTNLTSNQVLISDNKVMSTMTSNMTSNGSTGGDSMIKDKVTTINGVCSSAKVGGNGNDTLTSSGKCNDELTGGKGADKFKCGEGNDTIRDYNSKEGDVILDPQDCEKVT